MSKKGKTSDGIGSLLVAIGVALFIRWALVEAYVIPSGSMLPSLLIHDHIFVNKLTYGIRVPFSKKWLMKFHEPQRGEILVFRYPNDESIFYIKRIIGLPGDVITYVNGNLSINDKKISTRVPTPEEEKAMDGVQESELPGGKADYTQSIEEIDVPHDTLLSKTQEHKNVEMIKVPPHNYFVMGDNRDNSEDSRYWKFVPEENVIGRAMFVWLSCTETLPIVPICNPLDIRWNRFFHQVR